MSEHRIPLHLGVLFLLMVGILYLSGSRLRFEMLPNPIPRFLSWFTVVPNGFVKVVDIVDGDTLIVSIGKKEETVRLLGVDTPETKDPRKNVQCFGHEASDYSHQTLQGKAVRLVGDPMQTDTDMFNRYLRYVYLPDGTMLNERLVLLGYAFSMDKYPTTKTARMDQLESVARDNHRGLWKACHVTISPDGSDKHTNDVSP